MAKEINLDAVMPQLRAIMPYAACGRCGTSGSSNNVCGVEHATVRVPKKLLADYKAIADYMVNKKGWPREEIGYGTHYAGWKLQVSRV